MGIYCPVSLVAIVALGLVLGVGGQTPTVTLTPSQTSTAIRSATRSATITSAPTSTSTAPYTFTQTSTATVPTPSPTATGSPPTVSLSPNTWTHTPGTMSHSFDVSHSTLTVTPAPTGTRTETITPAPTSTGTFRTPTDTMNTLTPSQATSTPTDSIGTKSESYMTPTVSDSQHNISYTVTHTQPTPTLTHPKTSTLSLTVSKSISVIPPPPGPCPTIAVHTIPAPLTASMVKQGNFTAIVELVGVALWHTTFLQALEVHPPDTEGGFSAEYGFERLILPKTVKGAPGSTSSDGLSYSQWYFNNSNILSKEVGHYFPGNPNYRLTISEDITIIAPSSSIRVLQLNCPEVDLVTSFTIEADEPPSMLAALDTMQYTMGGIAVGAGAASGLSYVLDLQAVAMIGNMACGYPVDRARTTALNYFLSPFAAKGEGVMLVGNFFLSVGIIVLHLGIAKIVSIFKFADLEIGCATVRFPAITSTFVIFFHTGIGFISFRSFVRLESDSGTRVMGFFGTMYTLAVPFVTLKMLDRYGSGLKHLRYTIFEGSSVGKFFLPSGRWGPEHERNIFGRIVQSVLGEKRKWCIYPSMSMVAIALMSAPNPETIWQCQLQYACLGTSFIVFAGLVVKFRPHNVPASNLFAVVSFLLLSCMCWLKLTMMGNTQVATSEIMTQFVFIILLWTALRIVFEMSILFGESKCWRRRQYQKDHPEDDEEDTLFVPTKVGEEEMLETHLLCETTGEVTKVTKVKVVLSPEEEAEAARVKEERFNSYMDKWNSDFDKDQQEKYEAEMALQNELERHEMEKAGAREENLRRMNAKPELVEEEDDGPLFRGIQTGSELSGGTFQAPRSDAPLPIPRAGSETASTIVPMRGPGADFHDTASSASWMSKPEKKDRHVVLNPVDLHPDQKAAIIAKEDLRRDEVREKLRNQKSEGIRGDSSNFLEPTTSFHSGGPDTSVETYVGTKWNRGPAINLKDLPPVPANLLVNREPTVAELLGMDLPPVPKCLYDPQLVTNKKLVVYYEGEENPHYSVPLEEDAHALLMAELPPPPDPFASSSSSSSSSRDTAPFLDSLTSPPRDRSGNALQDEDPYADLL